jgi:hypothetical protein
MEVDALQVVNIVKANGHNWWRYGKLVDDARGVLNLMHSWQISHVRSDVNYVAHGLVITAVKQIIDQVSMKEIPCCICDMYIFFLLEQHMLYLLEMNEISIFF